MPIRFLFCLLGLAGLLTGCGDPATGPRLDLVGSSRFISADRALTSPADTLTAKVYAEARDDNQQLRRLRITVGYNDETPLVYLDSALNRRDALFLLSFGSRTTSGRETWRFEAEDTDGQKASRSFRVRLRNPDSTLVYHRYTVRLQAPGTPYARPYLDLARGLAFPSYTVRTNAEAQQAVDLIYLPLAAGGPVLAAPADPQSGLNWPGRRRTLLRVTSLSQSAFTNTDTSEELEAAYTSNLSSPVTRTPALTKGAVLAFITADSRYGLLYVADVLASPVPALVLNVRIQR
ncbi:hypothetical protein LJY25_05395 [Hymenobacter sp. BT175]|uniref:hypothetical protein n=1 Tax=Hymenobacter translucens TaxID=2886507 RepID=UPI001D0DF571|nr:hypothetical protein [Hymenobacter translucens]MCC2545870.1 hypothetical protein [Hymenobacter translucens]